MQRLWCISRVCPSRFPGLLDSVHCVRHMLAFAGTSFSNGPLFVKGAIPMHYGFIFTRFSDTIHSAISLYIAVTTQHISLVVVRSPPSLICYDSHAAHAQWLFDSNPSQLYNHLRNRWVLYHFLLLFDSVLFYPNPKESDYRLLLVRTCSLTTPSSFSTVSAWYD
jgi:hypothetical protein